MRTLFRIDSSYPIEELVEFCKNADLDSRDGARNMEYDDWENKPHTFLYLLYNEKRFDGESNGYVICKEDDRIICGAGFYLSDEIDNMICCGVRSYTLLGKNCSNTHGDIKDMVYDIAKASGSKGCFYSFNEHVKRYIDGYNRVNNPVNHISSYVDSSGQWWSKDGRKIHRQESYGPIRLKDTKQWISYHLFNSIEQPFLLEQLKKMDWCE